MGTSKGKEKVVDGGGKGKRKWSGAGKGDDDKTGRKRKNRGVLQFFEDSAYQVDEDEDSSDDSFFDDDDFLEEEFGSEFKFNNIPGKVPQLPIFPKEEEMSEEELERIMQERYKPGAGFVTFAEDGYDNKRSIQGDLYVPSSKDPTIWKVKCMVGRERYSAFCLMQKYVDLEYLGMKLQIISAFALDHVKGSIFMEAEKQTDIYEASKGLCTIYPSRVAPVPSNEFSRLLSFRSKSSGISQGMWARVKNGKYKGDLGQVVAVNDARKKVTVKLVPRIDLKSMAEKFGGGVRGKRTAIAPQRLISSRELEEFRPLIQRRRDRDTNEMFEVLDGMMLKDGYLYKKISIDSLSFWGVIPTEDELLKFEPSKKDESTDTQWLSQLFGEKMKKQEETVSEAKGEKGGGKGEGSSSSTMGNGFEAHDLVFFGRNDFGVVIGSEKDDTIKVIKEGSEGPAVVNVKQSELKTASFDKKLFSVLDQHSKTVSVNDIVRVLDGPLKDRQGVVKKIYKGVLFLCDENESENNGYICVKAQLCEKVNLSGDESNEKVCEPTPSGFADLSSSPKSPLSPKKSWQERDSQSNFKREDNAMFAVGQSLRIRVGPLKGYLCRVLAVRRSDVTVKLDSQQKILTVKCEHLSEVRGRNSAISQGGESGSIKPFDLLGGQDGAGDWMGASALATGDDSWNAAGSTERRDSWSTFPSSSFSLSADTMNVDAKKGTEDSGWQVTTTSNQNSSWGAAAADQKMVTEAGAADGWGTSGGWKQTTPTAVQPHSDGAVEKLKDDTWGKAAEKWSTGGETSGSKVGWGSSGASTEKASGDWDNEGGDLNQPVSGNALESQNRGWGNAGGDSSQAKEETGGWKKSGDACDNQTKAWDTKMSDETGTGSLDKALGADSGSAWNKQDSNSSWSKPQGSSWSKQDSGSEWGKQERSLNKPDEGSSWKGESSWSKPAGGSSWGHKPDVNAEEKPKSWNDPNNRSGGNEGFGGWKRGGMGNGDDNTSQEGGWQRSNQYDGGRGSGGRRGRGGGWGGRDQYGRGRSRDEGQSNSWSQSYGSNDGAKNSSWSSDQAGGWSNTMSAEGSKKDGGWATSNFSSKDEEKNPNNSDHSSWNTGSTSVDVKPSADWSTGGNWGSQKASEENNPGATSGDGNQSDWSSKGNWGSNQNSGNEKDGQGSKWKSADGGSSTGWGQSNWSKGGTSDAGGNGDTSWSSKSNWSSGGGFGESNNQDDTSGDRGRGGSWRGGHGGRGDRGGFRGRGGSDRGGFGGRGGFSRGGFGGRGSDRGGFGDGGGADKEGGFRGRGGGFRGRGRGNWNNRGGDSNEDKPYSSGGWKSSGGSGGSWKQGDGDNNQQQSWSSSWNQPSQGGSWNQGGSENKQQSWGFSWNQPKVDASSAGNVQTGEWGKGTDSKKDASPSDCGVSAWDSSNASGKEASAGWNKSPADKDTGGWNQGTASGNINEYGDRISGQADLGQQSKESKTEEGPADDPWGKKAASSWGAAPANVNSSGNWQKPGGSDGGQTEGPTKDEGPSSSWGKATTSSWDNSSGKGGW